jgi:hypothetical protein
MWRAFLTTSFLDPLEEVLRQAEAVEKFVSQIYDANKPTTSMVNTDYS